MRTVIVGQRCSTHTPRLAGYYELFGRRSDTYMMTGQPQLSHFAIEGCRAADAHAHGAALTGWEPDYAPVRSGPFNSIMNVAWLGPLQLVYERVENPFSYRGVAWRGSRFFLSLLPGSAEVFYENRPVGTGGILAHRWNEFQRMSCGRRLELVGVAIDERALERHCAQIPRLDAVVNAFRPIYHSPEPALLEALVRTIKGVIDDLLQRPEMLHQPRIREGYQKAVLDSLANVFVDAGADSMKLPAPSTRAFIVDRALDYLEPRLADAISIGDICASVRVCPRALSYAFARVLGTSPKSYLLTARLNRVRRELRDPRTHVSIESVAMRWGFAHMGRFAQYYRAAFGERPSETHGARVQRRATPDSNSLKAACGTGAQLQL